MGRKIFTILIFAILLLTGCADPPSTTRKFLIGIGPIPRQFPGTEETWVEMFELIPETGDMVIAQNKWRDSKEESGTVPEIIRLLYQQDPTYGPYEIFYGISFMEQGPGTLTTVLNTTLNPTNNWTNKDAQEKYTRVAETICRDYNPKYLALAIEINTYYQHPQGDKEDFLRFVEFYKNTYDNLKAKYPDTHICVTFQLEQLRGLGEKSWGYEVEPEWELLGLFDGKLDVLAFTTYPFMEYETPQDIPDDYYTSIMDELPERYKTTPIVFSEIGWSSGRPDEQAQVDFLDIFLDQIASLDVRVIMWVMMHDLSPDPTTYPGFGIGLKQHDGTPKKIWYTWKALKEIPYAEYSGNG